MITMIYARSVDWIIGLNHNGSHSLPWRMRSDLQHFKKHTLDSGTVVMGITTFASLNYRPLPGRKNVVLTRTARTPWTGEGQVEFHNSVDSVLSKHQRFAVIGGAQIYTIFFEHVEQVLETIVLTAVSSGPYQRVSMPRLDRFRQWEPVNSQLVQFGQGDDHGCIFNEFKISGEFRASASAEQPLVTNR